MGAPAGLVAFAGFAAITADAGALANTGGDVGAGVGVLVGGAITRTRGGKSGSL